MSTEARFHSEHGGLRFLEIIFPPFPPLDRKTMNFFATTILDLFGNFNLGVIARLKFTIHREFSCLTCQKRIGPISPSTPNPSSRTGLFLIILFVLSVVVNGAETEVRILNKFEGGKTETKTAPLSDGLSEPLTHHHRGGYGDPIPYHKVMGTTGSIAVEIAGGKLYALAKNELRIYDISSPREPKLIGAVEGFINARQLAVRGNTAYITSRQCGLWIVNVSDPRNPQIISNFDAIEMATGLDVAGDVAFIGARTYGVQAVDVSDPNKPRHINTYRTDESQSVLYRDKVLFSGDWARGEVTVLDVSDLNAIKPISIIQLDGNGDGIFLRDNVLFASTGWHKKSGPENEHYANGNGLDIFDISDLRAPVRLSSVKFPKFYMGPSDFWTPRVTGNYCIASNTANGLFLLDISDLKNPKFAGNLILPKRDIEDPSVGAPWAAVKDPATPRGDPVASIALGDGVVYIAGEYTGLYIMDIPEVKIATASKGTLPKIPENLNRVPHPEFISSHDASGGAVRSVEVIGDIAYAACSNDGLKVFRLSENSMTEITQTKIPYAASVKIKDGHLYIAEGPYGLGIYQMNSETEFEEIARIKRLGGFPFVQYLWLPHDGKYLMASSANSNFFFINIENPVHPEVASFVGVSGLIYGDYGTHQLVDGKYFAMTTTFSGLIVSDLSGDLPKTVFRENFPLCSQTSGLAAWGDRLFVVNMSGYSLIDMGSITKISDFKRYKFPDMPDDELPPLPKDNSPITRSMIPKTIYDGFPVIDQERSIVVMVNRMFKTLGIYDFSDMENPKFVRRYFFQNNIHRPVFWKDRLVLPAGYSGLLLKKKSSILDSH